MSEVKFVYEITKADYAQANALISHKLKQRKSWMVPLLGVALLAVPFSQVDADGYTKPDLHLLWFCVLAGLSLIYYGIRYQSTSYVARQNYAVIGIEHHPFTALISSEGVRVRGTFSEWSYAWHAVLLAEESQQLFALYTGLQLFIFAKRHMSDEQVNTLRSLISAQAAFAGGTTPKY
jgi:hypothetical protein